MRLPTPLVLLATALVFLGPLPSPATVRPAFRVGPSTFQREPRPASPSGWYTRTYDENGDERVSPVPATTGASTAHESEESPAVPLAVSLPHRTEFVREISGFPVDRKYLTLQFQLPADLPSHMVATVFCKDWDHLWRQIRFSPMPGRPGGQAILNVPIAGPEAARAWIPVGHARPWHALTPSQVVEWGVAFEPESASPVRDVTAKTTVQLMRHGFTGYYQTSPGPLRNLSITPLTPAALTPVEIAFEYPLLPHMSPFDRDDVSITAHIAAPDGTTHTAHAFYYQGFRFADPQAVDVRKLLAPQGTPQFRVRFTPRVAGEHRVELRAEFGKEHNVRPDAPASFAFHARAADPDNHGFVQRHPTENQLLQFADGTPFWGAGMNVRSPYDNRYRVNFPFTHWEDEGLHLYKRLFPTYRECGINVVEVWMSSWWLALEWIPDAPGNHGVGWMNQYRAWMLDRIVEWAAENDIYLVLVFNNHGKFGEFLDTEWKRNPFNTRNGGYLDRAAEFFWSKRARRDFERLCNYVIARYAHSPHILTWKLFTEIDLTGPTFGFYQEPVMAQWHRYATEYLHRTDPYNHLVTTHWMLSFQQINYQVSSLPGLDLLTTDAYYRGGGTQRMLYLIQGGTLYGRQLQKPLMITEFGGSAHADNMSKLITQLDLGIWTGFFCGAPVAPFYWWFALVEEKDLYDSYRLLDDFAHGIDRAGMRHRQRLHPESEVTVYSLDDSRHFLAFAFDTDYYYSRNEAKTPADRRGVTVRLPALEPGAYRVEQFSLDTGRRERRDLVIAPNDGRARLEIHPFRAFAAVKVWPKE